MRFSIATQPTGTDIVSLDDMKEFLRVEHTDEDTTITAIIDAAVQAAQDYTGRHFVSSVFSLSIDSFYNVEVPTGITTISGISYFDSAGDSQTLSVDKYYADFRREPGRISFIDPPSTHTDRFNAVVIAGTLGDTAYPPIKHAIKMLAAHYYENRRAVIITTSSKIPLGIEAILNPYRIISLK
jgi:uncharacterized phiE125 gp8 family phage protein